MRPDRDLRQRHSHYRVRRIGHHSAIAVGSTVALLGLLRVTFAEDLSQIHTGSGPHVTAGLRNLAISLHRLALATNIAKAVRHHGRNAPPTTPTTQDR